MLTTMLVALGALLLAVVGCAVLNPGPPPGTRETDYRESPFGKRIRIAVAFLIGASEFPPDAVDGDIAIS